MNDEYYKELAERMKAFRKRNNLSMERSAARLGVSIAAWFHWERGDRRPNYLYLKALEDFLKKDEETLDKNAPMA